MFLFRMCEALMEKVEPPPHNAIKGITPTAMNKKSQREEDLERHAAEAEKRVQSQRAEEAMQDSFRKFDEQQAILERAAMEHKRFAKQYADKYRAMKSSDPEKKKYQQMAKNRLEMYNRTLESLKVLETSRHKLSQLHHGVITSQQNKEIQDVIRAGTDALKQAMGNVSPNVVDETFLESQMLLSQAAEISAASSQAFEVHDGAWVGDAALDEQLDELFALEDIPITQVDYAPEFSATASAAALPPPPTPLATPSRRSDVRITRMAVALHK
jgi:predicted RNase H-like nuclease (RuvC/YqgF family)